MTKAADLALGKIAAVKTALIEFTDGDDAIAVADAGVVTLLTTAVAKSEGGAVTTNIAQGLAKAWVRTKTASVTITDSFNMSSVTDSAVGRFAPQINSNMNDGNYCCVLGADDKQDGASVFVHAINDAVAMATTGYGTSFKKFSYADADPNDNASSLVMGDLA